MDSCAAPFAFAAARIRDSDLPEAPGSRIHGTGLRVLEELELEFPQRLVEPERRDAAREHLRLDKGDGSRSRHLANILQCSTVVKFGPTGRLRTFAVCGSVSRRFAAGVLPALFLTMACGGDRSEAPHDLPTAPVELDLRIDGYAADLVPVTWIGIRLDGTVALVQQQVGSLRFFDRAGDPLGTFGRGGEGPGEFRRPIRGGWVADTLWIDDTQLNRVTLISPELELVRTIPRGRSTLRPAPGDEERIPEFRPGTPYAVYPGDTMLVVARPVPGDPLADIYDGSPLIRASADVMVDRIVAVPPLAEGSVFFVAYEGGGAGITVPFYPRPVWAVSPSGDRVAILTITPGGADPSSFRVEVVDHQGEGIYDRSYPAPTVPIPQHVLDSVVTAMAERTSDTELRRAILDDLRDRIPSVYPPATDVLVGVDGRVWVALHGVGDGKQWLVLGPTGQPERRVVVPDNVDVRVVDGTYLWGLERDRFDVESVVRYRIPDRRRVE